MDRTFLLCFEKDLVRLNRSQGRGAERTPSGCEGHWEDPGESNYQSIWERPHVKPGPQSPRQAGTQRSESRVQPSGVRNLRKKSGKGRGGTGQQTGTDLGNRAPSSPIGLDPVIWMHRPIGWTHRPHAGHHTLPQNFLPFCQEAHGWLPAPFWASCLSWQFQWSCATSPAFQGWELSSCLLGAGFLSPGDPSPKLGYVNGLVSDDRKPRWTRNALEGGSVAAWRENWRKSAQGLISSDSAHEELCVDLQ